MRVLIAANPVAGTGRAREAARRMEQALSGDGHDVLTLDTRTVATPPGADAQPHGSNLHASNLHGSNLHGSNLHGSNLHGSNLHGSNLHGYDLLLVAGGDGAVRMCAPAAAEAGTALYHVPCGTENLFAREWGMRDDPDAVRRALRAWRVVRVDLGLANGQPFLLMASVGFDAEVVHHLAERRRGAISHLSYARPILARAWGFRPPRIGLEVDGQPMLDDVPGMVVVGNSRQYAARINPALRADMTDGLLDAVFLPLRRGASLLPILLRCWMRRQLRHPGVVYQRGREVVITSAAPARFQIDGDRPEPADPVTRLHVQVRPAALPVLLP